MKIDINKPVRTRDGRPVTLISDKGRKQMVPHGPVYNLLGCIGDDEPIHSWTAEGRFAMTASHNFDLTQELEVWINVYPSANVAVFTGPDAYHHACKSMCNPIARVRVPYTLSVQGLRDALKRNETAHAALDAVRAVWNEQDLQVPQTPDERLAWATRIAASMGTLYEAIGGAATDPKA